MACQLNVFTCLSGSNLCHRNIHSQHITRSHLPGLEVKLRSRDSVALSRFAALPGASICFELNSIKSFSLTFLTGYHNNTSAV